MPSLMCGCSGIHPLQQHIRLGIDLFATACLIEEGLACHLGGSWQELRAAWTKWKIPRKRTCSFLGIFHFVPENSCFEVFCNKDVLVRASMPSCMYAGKLPGSFGDIPAGDERGLLRRSEHRDLSLFRPSK